MSDLFSANDANSVLNTEINMSSNDDTFKSKRNNDDTMISKFYKGKPKTLGDSSILEPKMLKQSTDLNMNSEQNKGEKFIRLKTETIKEQHEHILSLIHI